MRFLLKTNQIILIKHIERLPYELRAATFQGIYSNGRLTNIHNYIADYQCKI